MNTFQPLNYVFFVNYYLLDLYVLLYLTATIEFLIDVSEHSTVKPKPWIPILEFKERIWEFIQFKLVIDYDSHVLRPMSGDWVKI